MQVCTNSVDYKLSNLWPPDQYRGPEKGFKFNIEKCRERFLSISLKSYNATICETTMQALSNSVDSKYFKPWPPSQC